MRLKSPTMCVGTVGSTTVQKVDLVGIASGVDATNLTERVQISLSPCVITFEIRTSKCIFQHESV